MFSAVTFSRTEPEGKLVMGYRKATNSTAAQVKACQFHVEMIIAYQKCMISRELSP